MMVSKFLHLLLVVRLSSSISWKQPLLPLVAQHGALAQLWFHVERGSPRGSGDSAEG